jgi:peptide-methionine (S)-S-oxide reductase
MSDMNSTKTEKATFGAGCFWQVEAAYQDVPGVTETAEVTQVTFDPDQISYEELVNMFWDVHDPTQMNRQGPDIGEQYRSVIFTHSPEQVEIAAKSKAQAQQRLSQPIVTTVEPATGFWMAEDYHQCYLQKRSERRGMFSSLLGH